VEENALYGIAATGNVGPGSGGKLGGVVLAAAAANATLVLREGGSGGAIIVTLAALANTSVAATFNGAVYGGQLHATLGGASAAASVEIGV
jgi:hypothetical protein